ncbi:Obscurin-like protein 1 [Platysternon megacephalum]|uniref:Obscurin-like protein 1 n=1 Tax=Platysternon megacephalum TaxID=55544 RepID=A0A4D9DP97_9SAUR|nr:Obscurin-like protein 1 [Platysternon megacephalum]
MDMFGGAPRFLAYPRTFTVQSGADAVLKCQIAGDPRPSIIWEKDKSPIALLGRFQVEAEGTVYSLSISQVTPADSGQYVCKAKNAIGETYAAATLKVEAGELQQEGDPEDVLPVFLSKPLSWQVCRGEDVMFTCRVSGQPCPVLQWEKDGRQLSALFESSHFSVGKEPEDWHFLKIFSARPPDGGVYVCRARNRSGEALAAAVLLVDPMARGLPDGPFLGSPRNCWPLSHFSKQPDQHGDRRHCHGQRSAPWPARPNGEVAPGAPKAKAFAVSEGKHAKFRCYVTGKPKPEIVWKKDGKVVAPDRRHLVYEDREGYFILKVLYCKARDQGLYICTASNTAGQTLSAVQLHVREHRVRFQLQLEDVEVQEWEDAVLECKVPLETIPTAWYLEDKQLQPSHKYMIEEQGLVRRLTIRDARADDDGIYLCEMKDKGRSIAEVSVRGAIVKRLPRKLDVMEGENAAFCVETRDAVEGIRWSRNGLELRETPCTVLKSFGKTHLLVLVHVTREDAGVISFSVGESQTSAQLRIKCAKRIPPSAPVAAEMSTNRSNAALLTWCPGPDVHRTPPSSYVLERQEASAAEWVQCLTTDLASMVEVLGDSVPAEADYCFRICAVNKYGRSRPVEFPGSVHLVPVACVRRALRDVQVQAGQDAQFSLELSASVAGNWFLNGAKLEEEEEGQRHCIKRSGTDHSLLLRAVRLAESEAEVKFVCSGVRDSATLRVQAPQVCIAPVPEAQRLRELLAGLPLLLACEVSTPDAPVRWLKDGEAVSSDDVVALQAEGCARRLFIRSARPSDSGTYTCDAGEDALSFTVTVTAPQVCIAPVPEAQRLRELLAGLPLLLACEVSTPDAPVRWLKDGEAVSSDDVVALQAEGCARRLFIRSARPSDSGTYTCDAGEDALSFTVTVTAPPVRVVNKEEAKMPVEVLEGESVTLVARLSQEQVPVQWLKNKRVLRSGARLLLGTQGPSHSLTIKQTELGDSGTFSCDTGDDEVHFTLRVKEAPVLFVNKQETPEKVLVLEGGSAVLSAIVSKEQAPVSWRGPQRPLAAGQRCELRREGRVHSLVLSNVGKDDAGLYTCLSCQDQMQFEVSVKELLVKFVRGFSDVQAHVGETVLLWCELCKAKGQVVWLKDGQELEPSGRWEIKAEGRERSLALSNVGPEDAGEYSCESKDDRTLATVTVLVPRVVEIISELHNLTVLEGDDATFKCLVSPDDVALTWQLSGQAVSPCERLVVTRNGLCHALTIRQCQLGDAGTVTARAEGLVSTARLSVQEAQVLFVRKLQDVVAEELQDALLEVELSREAGEVQWLKQGVLVQPGSKYQLQEAGRRRGLTIRSLSPSDRGTYRCESLHDRTQAKLSVAPRKVSVRKPLSDVETVERETATFQLELSHADVPGVWTRDGIRVKPSRSCRVSTTGCVHSLTLLGLTLEDSGTVTFTSDTLRSSARLTVREPPVAMVKSPRDVGVPETGAASFECELSRPIAEVKWYKDGSALRAGPKCRIYSVGRRRLLQLSHCSLDDAGEYTCEAGDCRASATLRVYERQVQIVQELVDVRVREHENAVFTCQVSHEDVKGEWFRGGEKIKVTSTVKIRQEGHRHFLLICSVRPEDAGCIRFVAKAAASEASLQVEGNVSPRSPRGVTRALGAGVGRARPDGSWLAAAGAAH